MFKSKESMPDEGNMDGLLKELEALFVGAISKAPGTRRRIEKLRGEGYELALRLECRQPGELVAGDQECVTWLPVPEPEASPPRFMIDRGDFRFLRSIGIDPTRKVSRSQRERE